MANVRLEGTDGRALCVGPVVRPYADKWEPWSYEATLTTESASASTSVWEYGRGGPAEFFRDIAAAWRGWEGVKTYSSLEDELTFECRHDGRGLVTCDVSLGSVVPPAWRLSAELTFGASAHLERLASELEAVFLT